MAFMLAHIASNQGEPFFGKMSCHLSIHMSQHNRPNKDSEEQATKNTDFIYPVLAFLTLPLFNIVHFTESVRNLGPLHTFAYKSRLNTLGWFN